jgi:hypothetical protein
MGNRSRYKQPPNIADVIAKLRKSAEKKVNEAIAAGDLRVGDIERMVEIAKDRTPADIRAAKRKHDLIENVFAAVALVDRSHDAFHAVYGEAPHPDSSLCTSAEPTVREHNEASLAATKAAIQRAKKQEAIRAPVKDLGEATAFLCYVVGLSHNEIAVLTRGKKRKSINNEDDMEKAEGASREALREYNLRSASVSSQLCYRCQFREKIEFPT